MRDIQSILPLSAAQEGMLFHVLSQGGEESYIEQGVCDLAGDLQTETFEAAWRQVVERHPALRTAIFWKGLSKPVQVTYHSVALPYELEDWRELPASERSAGLTAMLAGHRALGKELDRAPLMRLAVIRLEPAVWRVVWSIHHLIHDAWSLTIILREVLALYAGAVESREVVLQPAGSYLDFVRYQAHRSRDGEEHFWRSYLRRIGEPTAAFYGDSETRMEGWGNRFEVLSPELTGNLSVLLRSERLTLNSLVLGVWAAVLAAKSNTAEVLFGCVAAGRPVEFPRIDTTVGLFINTLPMRAVLRPDLPVLDWLRELQQAQQELARHEATPLSRIKAYSGKPAGTALFDSIVVYQSAFEGVRGTVAGALRVASLETMGHPNYPLMFRVTPGREILFEVIHDRGKISDAAADRLLKRTIDIAKDIAAAPARTAGALWAPRRAEKPAGSGRGRLTRVVAQAVSAAGTRWVRRSLLESEGTRIVLLQPEHGGLDPIAWAQSERDAIKVDLKRYGAILFRGFPGMDQTSKFLALVQSLGGDPIDYTERSSPRSQVGERIYTSTEHPADQHIFFHNENSYAHTWPKYIFFSCVVEPASGGETPLADIRSVYSRIPPAIRQAFEDRGVLYVRNFHEHLGVSWRTAFQSDSREVVEQTCRAGGYEFEWLSGGCLRTRRLGPAVCTHPETAERVWFNHAAFFHDTTLPADLRSALIGQFGEAGLPNQTYLGDGSPICEDAAEALRQAYRQSQIEFRWKTADILILDNMLVAHARNPFRGPRKILVSMTTPIYSLERHKAAS